MMKHLKLLPFLIAAAFAMPRAQAAEAPGQSEPISYGAGLLCLGLVLLANGRSRTDAFKNKGDE
ncbi:MAG TPA: hypothetical protein VF670_13930 [Duganella sp.]|jgi:hypothetical protein